MSKELLKVNKMSLCFWVSLLQAQEGGIDHFVLFKVKEGTSQESIDSMLQSFRDLAASLDPSIIFQLTAGEDYLKPQSFVKQCWCLLLANVLCCKL